VVLVAHLVGNLMLDRVCYMLFIIFALILLAYLLNFSMLLNACTSIPSED
jgi:hypothetical protein